MNKIVRIGMAGVLGTVVSSPFVLAAATKESWVTAPLTYVFVASAIFIILSIWSIFQKDMSETMKKTFFWIITISLMGSALYLSGHTVYHNAISHTKGPVHWHADFQIWECGERVDLVDPKFPRNKIGTPLFHEHNDERIHVEGTVMQLSDVDVGSFFEVIDGKLGKNSITYPTNEGVVTKTNGDFCGSDPGILKVYVNGKKHANAAEYVPIPEVYVPPGDCIIIDFSPGDAETTDKICEAWQVEEWDYSNFEQKRKE